MRPRLARRVVSQPGETCAVETSTELRHRKPVPAPRKNMTVSLQNPGEVDVFLPLATNDLHTNRIEPTIERSSNATSATTEVEETVNEVLVSCYFLVKVVYITRQ